MKVQAMIALCETDSLNLTNLSMGSVVEIPAKVEEPDRCIVFLDGDPVFIGLPVQRNGQRAVKITGRLPLEAADESKRMNVSISLGTAELSPREALDMKDIQAVIDLDAALNDPSELFVNGELVACGEVVTVGSDFGMRIAELIA